MKLALSSVFIYCGLCLDAADKWLQHLTEINSPETSEWRQPLYANFQPNCSW